MSIDFLLPDLGEGIHEAEILNVMIKEGQSVKEDQPILEVETDKAVVEIPCPYTGTIDKVHVKAGQNVTVGSVMISFNLAGETSVAHDDNPKKATAATATTAVSAGKSNNNTNGNGSAALSANSLNSVPSLHSINAPIPCAPSTRRLARELGVDLRLVRGSGPANRVTAFDVTNFSGHLEGDSSLARDTKIEQISALNAAFSGSGNGCGIGASIAQQAASLQAKYGSSDDGAVSAHDGGTSAGPSSLQTPFNTINAQSFILPDFNKFGKTERIPLKSIRRKTAQSMTQSWTHIPHVTTMDEADVSELQALITQHEEAVKKAGGRLTLTVFALKAVASGLKKFPQFNSSLDEQSSEIIFKHYCNIGVAVATERGLIVPVIRDVDKKSVVELSIELAQMAEKTRAGKVEMERLQGGTFTLTNIGAIGGTGMVPMINHPEAAILGMARASLKPVVKKGHIEPALILPLALSFDHRIADGAEAAYFVQHIVKRLSEPFTFLLEA